MFSPSSSTSVLIVSHGSPSAPEAQERSIATLAERVAAHLPERVIAGATLAAPDALEAQIARLGHPVIFPLFMSDGYFIRHILAERIAPHGLETLAPFGLLPGLPDLIVSRLARVLKAKGWATEDTTLLIAAHGGQSSKGNPEACRTLKATLANRLNFRAIRLGFLENPPFVQDISGHLGQAICLSYFVQRAGHVLDDLPHSFARSGFEGVILPPLMEWPETPELIARALRMS